MNSLENFSRLMIRIYQRVKARKVSFSKVAKAVLCFVLQTTRTRERSGVFLQLHLFFASLLDKKTRVHLLCALTVKIFDVGFEFDGSAT